MKIFDPSDGVWTIKNLHAKAHQPGECHAELVNPQGETVMWTHLDYILADCSKWNRVFRIEISDLYYGNTGWLGHYYKSKHVGTGTP